MSNEPVVVSVSIGALVAAVLGLVVAFGVELSQAQTAAILAFTGVVGPVVAALIARRKVTPVD